MTPHPFEARPPEARSSESDASESDASASDSRVRVVLLAAVRSALAGLADRGDLLGQLPDRPSGRPGLDAGRIERYLAAALMCCSPLPDECADAGESVGRACAYLRDRELVDAYVALRAAQSTLTGIRP